MMSPIRMQFICLLLFGLVPKAWADDPDAYQQGKAIAFDRQKGNCLACHVIEDGELPGTIGPPLVDIQARYPDKAKLRTRIWDATQDNPLTSMPPFGKHGILTEAEIDKIVEYIYAL